MVHSLTIGKRPDGCFFGWLNTLHSAWDSNHVALIETNDGWGEEGGQEVCELNARMHARALGLNKMWNLSSIFFPFLFFVGNVCFEHQVWELPLLLLVVVVVAAPAAFYSVRSDHDY